MGDREKKVGEKEKGREMLPSYIQFNVVALPSGRGHTLGVLEMSCLRLNGKFSCSRLHSWDYLLILDTDELIFVIYI